MKMLWRRKRPKEGLRVLTEKEIQEKLYGSYFKKPEEDKRVVAEREARERLEKAGEEESLKRMKAEEELARLRAELDRTKKVLLRADKDKRTLQEKLSDAMTQEEVQVATRPKFRITSTRTTFNLSPKIVIPFLVLLLVMLASFRLIYQRKRELPARHLRPPISTAREEVAKPYTIQICVYVNKDESDKLVSDLKEKGYPAWLVSRISPKGKLYYNIYIGQFANHEDASKFLEGLRKTGEFEQFKDSFIRKR